MTKEERLQKLKDRAKALRGFENEYREAGHRIIAGVDEVGRGPLAGPVCAGAVILPKDVDILYINDSKQLSAAKREELYDIIKEKSIAVKTAYSSPEVIDDINILQATYLAMKRALDNMAVRPDLCLVDAVTIPGTDIEQVAIVKGDEKSLSIAAASIVAKVARDKYMEETDAEYPGYDFASNKGYGTAAHYEGLRNKGITPIHRRSFLKKFEENPNTGHSKTNTDSKEQNLAKKVYAVKKGRTTGIFMTWEDCKAQVDGFNGAEYKSFADPQDAMTYLGLSSGNKSGSKGGTKNNNATGGASAPAEEVLPPGNRAYVDGSYDSSSNRFSCGVVIIETDKNGMSETTELKAVFEDDVAALQRNVAGEVMGAKTAIDYCLENGIEDIEIYHDYEGVGKWADGLWKANNPLTQGYKQFIADARRVMSIRFVKVKAHAGNKYNEMADKLAKQALDL